MELTVSNYSISKLRERMPHRRKIGHLRHSNAGEITIKVETREHMSAPKAVRFKMPIFNLRNSYWLSWAAPCLVLGEPQAEEVQSPCKLLKTPPQSHFILDCGFHKLCQTFMAVSGTRAEHRFWSLGWHCPYWVNWADQLNGVCGSLPTQDNLWFYDLLSASCLCINKVFFK